MNADKRIPPGMAPGGSTGDARRGRVSSPPHCRVRPDVAGGAPGILAAAVPQMHQVLRLPQHLPRMLLRELRAGGPAVGGAGNPGPALPLLPP